MNLQRSFLLVAAAACAAGVALTLALTGRRRRHHKIKQVAEHKEHLGSWENEGGNLAPAAADGVLP